MPKKVALVLSGCGAIDGAEVQESVCSILAIELAGFKWEAFSLDEDQAEVKSPLTLKVMDQKRNMMEEAARITHGKIKAIEDLEIDKFDILWFPGGFGVVSSFSNISKEGPTGTVHPKIETIIKNFYEKKKPIVGVCVAPSIIVRVLSDKSLTVTLGKSDKHAKTLQQFGHHPKKIPSEEFVFDEINNIYSTPAYMNGDATCAKVLEGCRGIAQRIKNEKSGAR